MFMSVHGVGINDNDVTGFLRLGTDFDQNYYEIEVPLTPTNPGNDVCVCGNPLRRGSHCRSRVAGSS